MDDALGPHLVEQPGDGGAVGEFEPVEFESGVFEELLQPGFLQPNVVIGVEVIDAHHGVSPLEESQGGMVADEAGGTGKQEFHQEKGAPVSGWDSGAAGFSPWEGLGAGG
jgi:hypothetical protein